MFILRPQIKPEEDSGCRASTQRCCPHSFKSYVSRNGFFFFFFCGQLLPYVLETKLSLEKPSPSRWLHSARQTDRPYICRQIRKFHLMVHSLKKTQTKIRDKGWWRLHTHLDVLMEGGQEELPRRGDRKYKDPEARTRLAPLRNSKGLSMARAHRKEGWEQMKWERQAGARSR